MRFRTRRAANPQTSSANTTPILQAEGLTVNSRAVEEQAQRSDDTPGPRGSASATPKGLSYRPNDVAHDNSFGVARSVSHSSGGGVASLLHRRLRTTTPSA
jgi:hypothetical protein